MQRAAPSSKPYLLELCRSAKPGAVESPQTGIPAAKAYSPVRRSRRFDPTKGRCMMEPQGWQDILSGFQAAYSRCNGDFIILAAESGKHLSTGGGSVMGGGVVHLRPQSNTVPCIMFMLVVRGPTPKEVWNPWNELAGKAGAMLTPKQIADAGVFGEDDAQGVWMAFLFHHLRKCGTHVARFLSDEDACQRHFTIGKIDGLGHMMVLRNPFGASVRAVQDILYPKSSDAAPASFGNVEATSNVAAGRDVINYNVTNVHAGQQSPPQFWSTVWRIVLRLWALLHSRH